MDNGEVLEKVLNYYEIPYELSGGKGKTICPFHADINPSMVLDFSDGSWFCFGCGASGNAVQFVYRMERKLGEQLNDLQALQICTGICSATITRNLRPLRNTPRTRCKPSSGALYDEAYDYYHGLAMVPWSVSEAVEVDEARDYMASRGFKPRTLEKVAAKVTYNPGYPIIFPIKDNAKFEGWVCRTFDPEIEQRRKYLYNEGFKKAKTLCGEYWYDPVKPTVICEGFMDYMRFKQVGYNNVVAILGCIISPEQIEKLKKNNVEAIISALDTDEAGRRGTERLEKYFDVIKFPFPCDVKDPGEMEDEQVISALEQIIVVEDEK